MKHSGINIFQPFPSKESQLYTIMRRMYSSRERRSLSDMANDGGGQSKGGGGKPPTTVNLTRHGARRKKCLGVDMIPKATPPAAWDRCGQVKSLHL